MISWSDFVRRDERGTVVVDTRVTLMAPPRAVWSPPLPAHTLENVGASERRIISVELKESL